MWHTIFIQQLIWMYYFIHGLFYRFWWYLNSFISGQINALSNISTNISIVYISVHFNPNKLNSPDVAVILMNFSSGLWRGTINEWNRPYLLTVRDLDQCNMNAEIIMEIFFNLEQIGQYTWIWKYLYSLYLWS